MSSQVRVMRQLDELAAKVQGPLLDDEQSMIIEYVQPDNHVSGNTDSTITISQ